MDVDTAREGELGARVETRGTGQNATKEGTKPLFRWPAVRSFAYSDGLRIDAQIRLNNLSLPFGSS